MDEKSLKGRAEDVEVPVAVLECTKHGLFDGDDDTVDPVYQAKAKMLNAAFQEIGMGRYQWQLFIVAGFGWYADNAWSCITSLILNPILAEFSGFQGPLLILAQCIGVLVGSVFWSVGCDVWGRRLSFNVTLFITSVASLAAGGAPNAAVLGIFVAIYSFGYGGNLPVDSAVFLEYIPPSHQYLLTVAAVWWTIGQLVASLIAWPLIANFSCASATDCPRSSNQGWRYLLWTMGAINVIIFVLRFFVFHLHESPRYLIGRGRDEEAVVVIHAIAHYNGKTSSLTVDMLNAVGVVVAEQQDEIEGPPLDTSAMAALTRTLSTVDMRHLKALFSTKKMALSTTLLLILWAFTSLAYTLYNSFVPVFLQTRGADFGDGSLYITYRNQVILSVLGIPACFLAGWLVETQHLGRKGTLAIATALSGVVLFGSTTARTSNALLAWNCGWTFFNNMMYAVLYAITPEIFPAKDRGTGNGLVNAANGVFAVLAPIIALYVNLATPVPIYVSGALLLVSGVIALFVPFEPRGKASI